mmetsp:Transcript_18182/g.50473  ORF Transcript_18182/g.50473 Transcript_18182/m.50473 type:complete len:277 (+) Transcript_18182:208-1038(+)
MCHQERQYLEDPESRGDSKDEEEGSADDADDSLREVLREGGSTRDGNSCRDGVSANGTASNAEWILCCGQSDGGKEGSVTEFGGEYESEDAQGTGDETALLGRVAAFDFLLRLGQFFIHDALFHIERLLEGLVSEEGKRQGCRDIVQRYTVTESGWHDVEDLSDDDGDDGHDGQGGHGSHERDEFGSLDGQESGHEEGLITDLADEDEAEGLVESGLGDAGDEFVGAGEVDGMAGRGCEGDGGYRREGGDDGGRGGERGRGRSLWWLLLHCAALIG